jgi:hypothetical protein
MNLREARQSSGPRADPPARAVEQPRDGSAPSAAASRANSVGGKPFVFDHLFEARTDLRLSLEPIRNQIPTIVIDDFLKHPEEAREVVGSAPAPNWKYEKGGRNFVDYYDCRLRFPIRYPNSMIAAATDHSPSL